MRAVPYPHLVLALVVLAQVYRESWALVVMPLANVRVHRIQHVSQPRLLDKTANIVKAASRHRSMQPLSAMPSVLVADFPVVEPALLQGYDPALVAEPAVNNAIIGLLVLLAACSPYAIALFGQFLDIFFGENRFSFIMNKFFMPVYDDSVSPRDARQAEIVWKLMYTMVALGETGLAAIQVAPNELLTQQLMLQLCLACWAAFYWWAFVKIELEANRWLCEVRQSVRIMTNDRWAIQSFHTVFFVCLLWGTGLVQYWPTELKVLGVGLELFVIGLFVYDYWIYKPSKVITPTM